MVLAIGSVMCGADRWRDVALVGNNKLGWLKQCLELPNGIPSHATCGRVFAMLDPRVVRRRFLAWIQAITRLTAGHVIVVDGKQCAGLKTVPTDGNQGDWYVRGRPPAR